MVAVGGVLAAGGGAAGGIGAVVGGGAAGGVADGGGVDTGVGALAAGTTVSAFSSSVCGVAGACVGIGAVGNFGGAGGNGAAAFGMLLDGAAAAVGAPALFSNWKYISATDIFVVVDRFRSFFHAQREARASPARKASVAQVAEIGRAHV